MTTGISPVSGGSSSSVFDDFARFAAEAITPMTIETSCRAQFLARYSAFKLDRTSLVQLDAPDLLVHHEKSRGSQHTFQLLYSVQTGIDVFVPGRRFHLRPGEICLLDNGNPYSVEIAAPHMALDMIAPEDWLMSWIGDPHAVKSQPVSLNTKWGPPLASFLKTLSAEVTAGDVPVCVIEHHLGGLVSLALRGVTTDGTPTSSSSAMARRAVELIHARYDDPELTCLHIAKALGVAPRTLQKALAASGTTYQDLLAETRITRAKEILADPNMKKLNIAQVAYKSGFSDQAYFSRVFTRATGSPPARWRVWCGGNTR